MPAEVAACRRRSASGVAGVTPFTPFSTWPPLRPLAPWPSTPASSSATPRSGRRWRRCHAVETPVSPPPTIATSVAMRARSAGVGRGGSLSATQTERFSSGPWARTRPNPYPARGLSAPSPREIVHEPRHPCPPLPEGSLPPRRGRDDRARDAEVRGRGVRAPRPPGLQAGLPDPLGRLRRGGRDGARARDPRDAARGPDRPAARRQLRALLPARGARPGDRRDPRGPRRPRAREPELCPGPLPGLPLAHLHAPRGARLGAHLLAPHRAARPRRDLSAPAPPARSDLAPGTGRSRPLLRDARRPRRRDGVLQPRGQALAPRSEER